MARKGFPAEFRRRALDLIAAGKTVAEVAPLLEVSGQSVYAWRRRRRTGSSTAAIRSDSRLYRSRRPKTRAERSRRTDPNRRIAPILTRRRNQLRENAPPGGRSSPTR